MCALGSKDMKIQKQLCAASRQKSHADKPHGNGYLLAKPSPGPAFHSICAVEAPLTFVRFFLRSYRIARAAHHLAWARWGPAVKRTASNKRAAISPKRPDKGLTAACMGKTCEAARWENSAMLCIIAAPGSSQIMRANRMPRSGLK
jgi:hypothetical protein